jgi:hypothetical protein
LLDPAQAEGGGVTAYDREVEYLEQQLADGEMTNKEFMDAMRELNNDLRAQADEVAQNAYDDFMGRY